MGDFDSLFGSFDVDRGVRGRQFERVCKWFFENDPVYRHELKTVWLWKDWPGRWGGDAGIDLVAEDRNGALWAIQAKAYDPKYRVSKKDVDKFLAESGRKVFTYRMLIATTDLIDRTGERTIQQQEKRSSFFRLNDLRAAAVDWPASPDLLRPAKRRKPAVPRPHQKDAIRDVVKGFKTCDRGQLVMACGTGKTLAGLFITEKLDCRRTLVLLPSLSLLKQTLNEWRANCASDFISLPVCSDDTVAGTDDAAIAHTADLGVPVTTDPQEIAAFLRRRSGPLVVFSTYQSSPQIQAAFALGRVPGFDLVIADEAHRVAGPVSSDFATVLDPTAIKGERRLFMTATPRYFTGRVLKAAQDADYEVASMDDEKKFGPVFHRLPFGEAIERDLLTDYQVAIVGVDDATYREWAQKGTLVTRDGRTIDNAATLAGQIGLAKAMRKYELRRVISFHSRVKRAREFASSMPDVIDWMPARQRPKGSLWSDVATGEMPAGDRYVLLRRLGRLDDADRGLLANARCLSEGVDVPTLDGVAFIDPRRSEVDIVQAVGRAIRKSEAKTVGTIVIPVFIDTDEDPEAALDSSAFKPVWDVIQALRAHDEELGEQLDELRRQMGRKGGKPKLPGKIHLDVPATVGRDFANAFDTRLIERTTTTWEFWYGLLERYVDDNGHTRIPALDRYEGFRLGQWVSQQRYWRNKGTLASDRIRLLERFTDWTWDAVTDEWEEGFRRLEHYVEQHGNSSVPQSFRCEDGYRLGGWVTSVRSDYRSGDLNDERQERLRQLPGWSWAPRDSKWEEGFRRLEEFARLHGHTRVVRPRRGEVDENNGLGTWVQSQRSRHARGTLEADRIARLNGLPGGFAWDVNAELWEDNYRRLSEFAAEHGHCSPTKSTVAGGQRLGAWVNLQRTLRNKGKLRPDQAERLDALPGWVWSVNDAKWEEGFQHLLDYVNEFGTTRIRPKFRYRDYSLGTWVHKQRDAKKNGRLSEEKVSRLEDIDGWSWDPLADQWERAFALLENYVAEHGTTHIPNNYTVDGVKLHQWTALQRKANAEGTLSQDRHHRLTVLPDWSWADRREERWERTFSALEKFLSREGHALVPQKHVEEGLSLGTWVTIQRTSYRQGKLSKERTQRLGRLPGWQWDPPRGGPRRSPAG